MHQKYFSSEIHPNPVDIPDETVDEIMGQSVVWMFSEGMFGMSVYRMYNKQILYVCVAYSKLWTEFCVFEYVCVHTL